MLNPLNELQLHTQCNLQLSSLKKKIHELKVHFKSVPVRIRFKDLFIYIDFVCQIILLSLNIDNINIISQKKTVITPTQYTGILINFKQCCN